MYFFEFPCYLWVNLKKVNYNHNAISRFQWLFYNICHCFKMLSLRHPLKWWPTQLLYHVFIKYILITFLSCWKKLTLLSWVIDIKLLVKKKTMLYLISCSFFVILTLKGPFVWRKIVCFQFDQVLQSVFEVGQVSGINYVMFNAWWIMERIFKKNGNSLQPCRHNYFNWLKRMFIYYIFYLRINQCVWTKIKIRIKTLLFII